MFASNVPAFRAGSRWLSALAGAVSLVGLMLGGCAYEGGTDNPLVRRASWFSYLDGGGIRETCAPGSIDRYRLVYNGRYTEQLRSYEVTGDGAGGAILVSRALGKANLAELRTDDLLQPWRWQRAESRLTPEEMRDFTAALERSGAFDEPPDGLRLHSWRFYWVASGCRDGVFRFHAWQHPSPEWDRLAFPEFLFARDGTGVPVNPPRPISPAENFPHGPADERMGNIRFSLEVSGTGLGGIAAF